MRKIRELLSVNDKGMSIVMLVVITILLPNTILRGLGIPSDTEACLYDVYIGIGIYYVSRLLTICSLFYILYVQRYNFSVMMTIACLLPFLCISPNFSMISFLVNW